MYYLNKLEISLSFKISAFALSTCCYIFEVQKRTCFSYMLLINLFCFTLYTGNTQQTSVKIVSVGTINMRLNQIINLIYFCQIFKSIITLLFSIYASVNHMKSEIESNFYFMWSRVFSICCKHLKDLVL